MTVKSKRRKRTEHTPGPWKLHYDEGEYQGAFEIRMDTAIRDPGMYTSIHLIELYDGVWPEDAEFAEALANARIMTAAPELLFALKNLLALVEGEAPSLLRDDHHYDIVRSAIEKAEKGAYETT